MRRGEPSVKAALCQLPHSEWPVGVEVRDECPITEGTGNSSDGLQKVAVVVDRETRRKMNSWLTREYKMVRDSNILVVPRKTLVFSLQENGEKGDKFTLGGKEFERRNVPKVADGQTLMWLCPNTSSKSELIPVKVKGIGVPIHTQAQVWDESGEAETQAVIVTANYCSPTDGLCEKLGYVENYDLRRYVVPLKQLYHLEDITKLDRQYTSLKFVKPREFQAMSLDNAIELCYTDFSSPKVENDSTNSNFEMPSSSQNTYNLQSDKTSEIGSTPPNPYSEPSESFSVIPGKALRQETLTNAHASESSIDLEPTGHGWTKVQRGRGRGRERQSNKPEKRNIRDTDDPPKRRDSDSKSQYSPEPIVLFGKCFGTKPFEPTTTRVQVEGIAPDDQVAATPSEGGTVVGRVKLTCQIPNLMSVSTTFAGIYFERPLKGDPFEVRHIYGNEHDCEGECGTGRLVFIPTFLLLHAYDLHEKGIIRLIEQDLKAKSTEMALAKTATTTIDFKQESERMEIFISKVIDLSSSGMSFMGIRGFNNSCYIDSVLFALFGCTNVVDHCLDFQPEKNWSMQQQAICNILKFDIINPLRDFGSVEFESVFKFRKALAMHLNEPGYSGHFMDAEEFVQALFSSEILDAEQFLEFDSDAKEYICQIFTDPKGKVAGLQELLEDTFLLQDIKLLGMPQNVFIIKLPVSSGRPLFSKVVVPPKLCLKNLLVPVAEDQHEAINTMVYLRAVICLKNNHFTCLVKTGTNCSKKSKWIYHDSMPKGGDNSRIEYIMEVPEFGKLLKEMAKDLTKDSLGRNYSCEATENHLNLSWLDFMMESAYMCIYEP